MWVSARLEKKITNPGSLSIVFWVRSEKMKKRLKGSKYLCFLCNFSKFKAPIWSLLVTNSNLRLICRQIYADLYRHTLFHCKRLAKKLSFSSNSQPDEKNFKPWCFCYDEEFRSRQLFAEMHQFSNLIFFQTLCRKERNKVWNETMNNKRNLACPVVPERWLDQRTWDPAYFTFIFIC